MQQAPAVTIDRARLEADLRAIGETIVGTLTRPRDHLALRAVGIDLHSSISQISHDLAQLPDAEVWALLTLVSRELNIIAGARAAIDPMPDERAAIERARGVLGGL